MALFVYVLKSLSTILALCFAIVASAQFTDDFSDGNFTVNPVWSGQDSIFEVNISNQLQLNNPNALGEAYLSTPSGAIEQAHWQFLVQMDFNPSSSNLARVYLVANQPNLLNNVEGYFVELGNTSDEVSLYRQDGSSDVKIIDGKDGRLNTSTVNVRVDVFRDTLGNWKLYSDTTGAFNFYQEGTVNDSTYFSSSYFGVFCDYTSTRSDKFFFDDFVVTGQPYVDSDAPELLGLQLISDSTLFLEFSEAMDNAILNTGKYAVNNGIGSPVTVTALQPDNSEIELEFQPGFSQNGTYTLSFFTVQDLAGNTLAQSSADFIYFKAQKGDVIINEILADNSPVVGLSNDEDLEYVELYNRTAFDIDLSGWQIEDNLSSGTLPQIILPADSFVVLTSTGKKDSLPAAGFNGIFVGVPSFPGLNNGGELLSLRSPENLVVDAVNYSDDWYKDASKEDGGYSLERIDTDFDCENADNWRASSAQAGGTPGFTNSVNGTLIDSTAPSIVSLEILSRDSLLLVFSESVDSSVLNTVNYSIAPAGISVANVFSQENLTSFTLKLSTNINAGIVYELTINNIIDCPGNTLLDNTVNFAIPESPEADDVIISEVMADPEPSLELPEAEYIELVNRSDKVLNLKGWIFESNGSKVELPNKLMLEGDRLVLVEKDVQSQFLGFGEILALDNLPQLPNSSGTLVLSSDSGKVIDHVLYNESWYQSALKEDGGWSLEIIDENNLCEGAGNWIASKDDRGGTPAQVNSVAAENPDTIAPVLNYIVYEMGDTLKLYFDSPLDEASVLAANYEIDLSLDVMSVFWSAYAPEWVHLVLQNSPSQDQIYTLTITDITDCAGNLIGEFNDGQFGIPQTPDSGDVVINEILFNPNTGGSDFVELYNTSDKVIDLRDLIITRAPSDFPEDVDDYATCSETGFQLLPQQFVVLTESPNNIKENYIVEDSRTLLEVDGMPNYTNSDGIVALKKETLKM